MGQRIDPHDQELKALLRFSAGFGGKSVLEVGCGRGRLTRKFGPLAAYVDAIDPQEEKIQAALSEPVLPHIHYHQRGLEDFAPDRKYDLVLLSWSL